MTNPFRLASTAYAAYAEATGGKTFDGRPMPTWEEICDRTPRVAEAWMAAANAAALAFAGGDPALVATGDLRDPHPRDATWVDERENWHAEVKRLRAAVAEREADR